MLTNDEINEMVADLKAMPAGSAVAKVARAALAAHFRAQLGLPDIKAA